MRYACVAIVLAFAAQVAPAAAPAAGSDAVRVARWKDNKQAPFYLAFDDSCPSHIKNVVPELAKRGLVGTFYITPGKQPYNKEAWEKTIPASGAAVYGNHTFTHWGARDVAHLDEELTKAGEVIARCFPNLKTPRLISFGRPGVPKGQWNVTPEEVKTLLAKHHLVDRAPFWGAAIHVKTGADMAGLVDKALAKGAMGHLDFHGVGGDWLAATMPDFLTLLDKLVACRDRVWVTDPVSIHQYETERDGAEVKVLESGPKSLRVSLTCKADPKFYDLPLTLVAKVPAGWAKCRVTQGARQADATAADGQIVFDAVPGAEEVVVAPAK